MVRHIGESFMSFAFKHGKRGIGILEVMVAALVLGILYAAVSNLQKGNRETLMRIRGRDGATEVAQNIIDSMSTRGLASFSDDKLIDNGDGTWSPAEEDENGNQVPKVISVTRTWKGQPGGLTSSHDISVTYTVDVKFSSDNENDFRAKEGSLLLLHDAGRTCNDDGTECVSHVYAKKIDVTVSWPFKGSTQSISVSGVIR